MTSEDARQGSHGSTLSDARQSPLKPEALERAKKLWTAAQSLWDIYQIRGEADKYGIRSLRAENIWPILTVGVQEKDGSFGESHDTLVVYMAPRCPVPSWLRLTEFQGYRVEYEMGEQPR